MKKTTTIGTLRHLASLTLAIVAALLLPIVATAQIPDPPTVPTLVNDFAQLLSRTQKADLEHRLVAYDDSTSTQITVITVNDLEGLPIAEYAQQLGEKWGVGAKGKDNGVVLIVKPKTRDSSGEAFIAPGYGLEGALPDITCRHIVTDRMIPLFKENDYAGGINAGVEAIAQAAIGDFHDARQYDDDSVYVTACFLFVILLLVILYFVGSCYIDRYKKAKTMREKITTTMTFFFILATIYTTITGLFFRILMAAGARSGSSGGSSRGGSFGGFGGGSFGGGGGGGRW